jgi:hypothetical protein
MDVPLQRPLSSKIVSSQIDGPRDISSVCQSRFSSTHHVDHESRAPNHGRGPRLGAPVPTSRVAGEQGTRSPDAIESIPGDILLRFSAGAHRSVAQRLPSPEGASARPIGTSHG